MKTSWISFPNDSEGSKKGKNATRKRDGVVCSSGGDGDEDRAVCLASSPVLPINASELPSDFF